MFKSRINKIAVVQPQAYSQRSIAGILGYDSTMPASQLFEKSEINQRHLGLSPLFHEDWQDPKMQYEAVSGLARSLAIQAIEKVLASCLEADVKNIHSLIVATSSALTMPGLSSPLGVHFGLPANCQRYDLVGMGCVAALPTLTLADTLAANDVSGGYVLAVLVEVGSQALRPATEDKGRAVVNALFGDASVAMLISTGGTGPKLVHAVRNHSQDPAACGYATLLCEPSGSRVPSIGKQTPIEGGKLLVEAIDELLMVAGFDYNHEIPRWGLHPGGRAILDQLQAKLELSDEQVRPSRETLANYGNVIGCTALVALENALRTQSGRYAVLGVIGPGLSAGAILLDCG